jgi:hypothetical protein
MNAIHHEVAANHGEKPEQRSTSEYRTGLDHGKLAGLTATARHLAQIETALILIHKRPHLD